MIYIFDHVNETYTNAILQFFTDSFNVFSFFQCFSSSAGLSFFKLHMWNIFTVIKYTAKSDKKYACGILPYVPLHTGEYTADISYENWQHGIFRDLHNKRVNINSAGETRTRVFMRALSSFVTTANLRNAAPMSGSCSFSAASPSRSSALPKYTSLSTCAGKKKWRTPVKKKFRPFVFHSYKI